MGLCVNGDGLPEAVLAACGDDLSTGVVQT